MNRSNLIIEKLVIHPYFLKNIFFRKIVSVHQKKEPIINTKNKIINKIIFYLISESRIIFSLIS